MDVELDVHKFTKRVDDAISEFNVDKKIDILKDTCALYGGDFLPQNSGDSWVISEGMKYKNQYSYVVKELCDYLMEKERYEEAIEACAPACKLYPLDEWQTVKIRCLIALHRNDEAVKEYEAATKFFYNELGIQPPEDMTNLFEDMNRQNKGSNKVEEIVSHLHENIDESGAYYCTYPTFRDIYRMVSRISERNGESIQLMMCSLTDAKGMPITDSNKGKQLSYELWNTIKNTLRKGDAFTKYSPSQYMIMLVGTKAENASIVYKRIEKDFTKEHPSWNRYLEYSLIPTVSF
jgi:tetratricopeptide (TPR) repeat protein